MTKHLWEHDHPYYCNEGNYHAIDHHDEIGSWDEFVTDSGWFDSDLDMNLLFRWDWNSPTRAAGYDPEDYDGDAPSDELLLFFVMQRKANLRSVAVKVTDADEPAVRAFLAERAAKIRDVWAPFLITRAPLAPAHLTPTNPEAPPVPTPTPGGASDTTDGGSA